MKKKKLFLSLLLVLTLVLVLLPGLQTKAEAAAANAITVYGYILDSGYYLPTATWRQTTTKPSGSYFYYNNGTLTLYNTTVTPNSGTTGIYADGDLVVNLSGTNKITPSNGYAIKTTGTLKFTGSGSLTVNGGGSYDAIYSGGNMEFAQTGSVTATVTGTNASGVFCASTLTVSSGTLTASADTCYAILASGGLTMTGGTVNATGNCTYSYGGIRSNGAMTVNGGTLNVTSKTDGIISKNDFWQKGGNVTVDAAWNGVIVENSTNDARISAGTLTVTAVRDGLKARKFYMNGGHGYIKSTNTSSDSSYYAVKLAENTSSYFYMQGSVKASGSTTTSSGGLTNLTYANIPTYDYVFFTGYISVNGVELRDGHYLQSGKTTTNTSVPSGGYAYYSGNTLTLNNYEGNNTAASGIYSRFDLNIVLTQGSVNKLTTSTTNGTTYRGVNVSGTLKISGLGQLTISGGQYAIYSTGSLTIGASVIKIYGSGIYSGSTISLDGAMLDMTNINSYSGMACAIKTNYNLYIDGGAIGIYAPNSVTLSGTSTAVGVTGISANYIETSASMGLQVSGNAISSVTKTYINGGTLDIVVKKNDTRGINAKEISIAKGTLNFSGESEGFPNYGLYATDKITISGGTVNVDFGKYSYAMSSEADIAISGGVVNVESYRGIHASYGNLNISGGTIHVSTSSSALYAGKATFTGGMATFRNTEGTGLYGMASVSSSTFMVGDGMAAIGSENSSGKNYELLNIADLPDYNYISIGDFVMLHDVVLPTGSYLATGNSSNTPTTVKPSGGYAYYKDGVLTLSNYSYSGSAIAVWGDLPLTIQLSGVNQVNHIKIHASTTFTGDGSLKVKQNTNYYGVFALGELCFNNGQIDIDTPTYHGIYCHSLTIRDGKVTVTSGNMNGVNLLHGKLTIIGGVLIAKSGATYNDTDYCAIKNLTLSFDFELNGLNHMVNTEPTPYGLPDTELVTGDYDFVALGEFVMVRGVILGKGECLPNGKTTPTTTIPDTGYAYCANANTVILKDYSFSGGENGVLSNMDLTVILDGANTLDVKNKSESSGNSYLVEHCNAILVRGDLTIGGRTYETDTLTAKSIDGMTIHCTGDLTIESDQITATSEGNTAIYVTGSMQMNNGSVTASAKRDEGSAKMPAIEVTGNVTVSGGILVANGSPNGGAGMIVQEGDFRNTGCTVITTGAYGTGLSVNKGNLNMQGGELYATGLYSGISLRDGRLNVSDGYMVATSTNTASDSSYCALDLAGSTSSYYNVANSLSQGAAVGSTKTGLIKLNPNSLNQYDYVQIGKYIEIGGYTVMSGQSINGSGNLKQGNGGSGYAYYVSEYAGNSLTLNGYSYSGDSSGHSGIDVFTDLTINVTSNSTITTGNTAAIHASGKLTFTGTGTLIATSNKDAVTVYGEVVINSGDIRIVSESEDALVTDQGDVTINGGSLRAFGYKNGIYSEQKVAINGGNLIAGSTSTKDGAKDEALYCAVNAGSFTYQSSLYVGASTTRTNSAAEIYSRSKHSKYDYLYVGDFAIVGDIIVPNGYYLAQGSTEPTTSANSSNYAYYKDGKLTLSNYNYTGNGAIRAPHALEMNLVGTNVYSDNNRGYCIFMKYDLAISGTGSLTMKTDANIAMFFEDNRLTIDKATVNVDAHSAISHGITDLTVNSGKLTCSDELVAQNLTIQGGEVMVESATNGVTVKKFVVNGGKFLATSTNTETDSEYMALKADTVTLADGLGGYAAPDANGTGAKLYDPSKLDSYDYFKVDVYTAPPVTSDVTVKCIGKAVTYTVSGNVVTVTQDKPCKVGYLGGDGKYVTLKGTKNSDGSYSFTVPSGVTEILLGIKGDISGDGRINVGDVSKLYAHVKQTSPLSGDILFIADISGDNRINVGDVSKLYANVKQTALLTWDT